MKSTEKTTSIKKLKIIVLKELLLEDEKLLIQFNFEIDFK